MMLDFAVRNDNDYAVKDFTIKCQHFGPSDLLPLSALDFG
jgi:hypothetical protein